MRGSSVTLPQYNFDIGGAGGTFGHEVVTIGDIGRVLIYKRSLADSELSSVADGLPPADGLMKFCGAGAGVEQRSSGESWGTFYNHYVEKGMIFEQDAYATTKRGALFVETMPPSSARQLRWTLLPACWHQRFTRVGRKSPGLADEWLPCVSTWPLSPAEAALPS